MSALDEGRTFVVTRNSVPVGELRPLRRRRLVDVRLVTELFRSASPVDAVRFWQDLDAAVDGTSVPMSELPRVTSEIHGGRVCSRPSRSGKTATAKPLKVETRMAVDQFVYKTIK